MGKLKVRTYSDIEEFEKVPIEERLKFGNTYDMLKHGANINPHAPAISFIPSGVEYTESNQITYQDFISYITRTANLFYDLSKVDIFKFPGQF